MVMTRRLLERGMVMAEYTIVTDQGFQANDWDEASVLLLNGEDDESHAVQRLDGVENILITFGGAHDGRGFSLARKLREAGFKGHIRAKGPLVTDQWRHLRQTGFDSLMLSAEQVEKMPLSAWQDVQNISLPNYQRRVFSAT